MNSALLIRLRPIGPWRYGPSEGGRDRVDLLFRSDRLFSAVTLALKRLDLLNEWLDATARSSNPAVAFSSFFPFQGDTLFAPPPAGLWPPPPGALRMSSPVFQTKVRWRAARFVPLPLIETLLLNQRILVEQWIADGESGCLLRRDRPQSSPFRTVTRTQAAVDRLGGTVESHSLACVEFEPGAGLWTVAGFANEAERERWSEPLKAAFRLLSDTGFGGRRSSGWGQAASPEFEQGAWPALVLPKLSRSITHEPSGIQEQAGEAPQHWLLSLFSPAPEDSIDWTAGHYALITRGGRIEDGAGQGFEKKMATFIEEGSVLASSHAPIGTAVDVAPDGFEHPVYRAGIALTVRLPFTRFAGPEEELKEVSEPSDEPASDESGTAEPEDETPDRETDREEFFAEQPGGDEVPLQPTDVEARREEAELAPDAAGEASESAEHRMEHLPPHRREHMLEPESSQTIGEESGEQADSDEIQLEPTDIEARREEAQNALPEEAAGVEYPPAVSESVSREDETPPEQREPERPTPAEREPEDTPEPPLEEPDEQQPEGDPQPEQPGQQLHQNSATKESEDEL
jgi:CRISPR type III-A-associated RAMP protein Csm4